jgi:hypothetical protein
MRQVRIKNDGKPAFFTEVTDAETGEKIEMVTKLTFTFDAKDRQTPMALLYVAMPVVDVIVDAEIRYICPVCGKPTEEDA